VNGQLDAPAALPPGKEPPVPTDMRLGGPQNRSQRRGEEKIFALPGLELRPSAFQPVASRCTDCTIPAPLNVTVPLNNQQNEEEEEYEEIVVR
jgi:hypothetical protein